MTDASSDGAAAPAAPISLLWTGGWDSTFRVLSLVLEQGATVQPWYVLDEERASTGTEIDTMLALRAAVAEQAPRGAILPTRYREKADIPPDAEATARFRRLTTRVPMGPQYRWLAWLAAAENLDGLELSVHREDRAHAALEPYVEPYATPVGASYRLVANPEEPDAELFRPFRFPLLDWTKPAMQEHAARAGYADLLERTWFCHSPVRGRPCGLCGPCGFAIDEGVGRRVPLRRRVRRRLTMAKRRWVTARAPGAR